MISIMLTPKIEIFLPRVDHLGRAEEAAYALWNAVYRTANAHGGEVALLTPEDLNDSSYGVLWTGHAQWADAYIVSDGADTRGFVASAVNGDTVLFTDTD
jgi:hypothetical protein